jgi:hypothetical protein
MTTHAARSPRSSSPDFVLVLAFVGRSALRDLPFSLNCPRAVRLAVAVVLFAVPRRRQPPARDPELRLRDDVVDFRAELLLFAIPAS